MNLPTEYQSFIHLSRYARWRYDEERRETWDETVERYFNFFSEWLEEKHEYKLENGERTELENAVKELKANNLNTSPSGAAGYAAITDAKNFIESQIDHNSNILLFLTEKPA